MRRRLPCRGDAVLYYVLHPELIALRAPDVVAAEERAWPGGEGGRRRDVAKVTPVFFKDIENGRLPELGHRWSAIGARLRFVTSQACRLRAIVKRPPRPLAQVMPVINILERAYLKNSLIDHLDEVVSVVLQQARVCRIKTLYIKPGLCLRS